MNLISVTGDTMRLLPDICATAVVNLLDGREVRADGLELGVT